MDRSFQLSHALGEHPQSRHSTVIIKRLIRCYYASDQGREGEAPDKEDQDSQRERVHFEVPQGI